MIPFLSGAIGLLAAIALAVELWGLAAGELRTWRHWLGFVLVLVLVALVVALFHLGWI